MAMLTLEDIENVRHYVERKSEVDPRPEIQERCRRLRELINQVRLGSEGELPSDTESIDNYMEIAGGLRELQP
jgi:hypothetical protein